jgi:electron transport complex protein RnfB
MRILRRGSGGRGRHGHLEVQSRRSRSQTGLGAILGLDVDTSGVRMVARPACAGGDGVAVRDFLYSGYADCEAAYVHFQGDKGCKYGCLGLGSCVKSCPVDAISYTDDGLVRVDPKTCIGCESVSPSVPPE